MRSIQVLSVLAIVLAVTIVSVVSSADEQPAVETAKPLAFVEHLVAQQKRHDAMLKRVLSARVDVSFNETRLDETIKVLAERSKLPLRLELPSLSDAGIEPSEPISFDAPGSRLVAVLDVMLRDLLLTWVIENDVVVITTLDLANERLQSRVFVVDELITWVDTSQRDRFGNGTPVSSGFGGSVFEDAQQSLINMIQQNTTAMWEGIDGAGGTLSFTSGLLVVRQTESVLLEISRLISKLRQILKTEAKGGVWLVERRGRGAPECDEVRQKLDRKIAVNFQGTPLDEALQSIGKELDISVLLDEFSLADAGIPLDEPITLKSEAALHSVLSQMLTEFQLTYRLSYAWMEVTTVDIANEGLTTAIFDVRDLKGSHDFSADDLIETIQSETNGMWEDIDGAGGTIQFQGGLIFLTQTPETLSETQVLLTNLREKQASRKVHEAARLAQDNRPHTQFYNSRSVDEVAALREALTTLVFPETWETNGGEGFMHDVGPTLIVRQTPRVHSAIARFLLELNSGQPAEDSRKP
ncbi:MAG: hypothetical protein H8E37_09345 [Planctomycetes bacterium]|nr:hypothetical protein [Planctomycetota bacterium]